MVMICGHAEGCMYRYRHRGITHKICLPCVFEYLNIPEIGTYEGSLKEYMTKQQKKVEVPTKKPIQTKEKTVNKK